MRCLLLLVLVLLVLLLLLLLLLYRCIAGSNVPCCPGVRKRGHERVDWKVSGVWRERCWGWQGECSAWGEGGWSGSHARSGRLDGDADVRVLRAE